MKGKVKMKDFIGEEGVKNEVSFGRREREKRCFAVVFGLGFLVELLSCQEKSNQD